MTLDPGRANTEVVAVIPARYASTRFPGKPLALIDGVPMVVRVLRNVRQASRVDRAVVATDDERIACAVQESGGEVMMTSSDLPSGSDRVWAAVDGDHSGIVVNVQGDEPLLPGVVIDSLVEALLAPGAYDIATPVVSVPRQTALSPDVVTVARDDEGTALYFSRSLIPHGSERVWRHLGVYAYRRDALERYVSSPPTSLEGMERLEQLRALSLGLRMVAVEVDVRNHAVDRPADITVVEELLGGGSRRSPVGVRLVVLDVDGVLTEGGISYLGDGQQLVTFNAKDGYGIVALIKAGIDVAVLSARDSPALRRRAAELGITNVRAGVTDKARALEELARSLAVPLSEVCYVGDDQPDVAPMAMAGLAAAPADAASAAKAEAGIQLEHRGGRGAVRELADLLLGAG